jgi:hypothetical protein
MTDSEHTEDDGMNRTDNYWTAAFGDALMAYSKQVNLMADCINDLHFPTVQYKVQYRIIVIAHGLYNSERQEMNWRH